MKLIFTTDEIDLLTSNGWKADSNFKIFTKRHIRCLKCEDFYIIENSIFDNTELISPCQKLYLISDICKILK